MESPLFGRPTDPSHARNHQILEPYGSEGFQPRNNPLRLTATHLQELDVIDRIVEEPPGGAHRNPAAMAEELSRAIYAALEYLGSIDPDTLREKRLQKFLAMGEYEEESS